MKFYLIACFCLAAIAPAQMGVMDNINNGINKLENRFRDVLGNMMKEMEQEISSITDGLKKLPEDVKHCYESQFGNGTAPLNSSSSFQSLSEKFYEAFPDKTITKESLGNLGKSIMAMVEHCLDSKRFGNNVKLGFTQLSDFNDEQLSKLNGYVVPDNATTPDSGRTKRFTKDDPNCAQGTGNLPSSFDWRSKNAVTPVKDQKQCGSCWAFSTTATVESAMIIKNRVSSNVDASEQSLVNCARNGCNGGNSYTAYDAVYNGYLGQESETPYVAKDQTCHSLNAYYPIYGSCIRSKYRYTSSMTSESLSDYDIQQTLVKFGPLFVVIDASSKVFQNYRSGVINDASCGSQTNHAVTLVGYTPDAWIIKNSWNTWWGESGYVRLARGKNMCLVNTEIAWPIL